MEKQSIDLLTVELKEFKRHQIETVLQLLEDGNTIPFIARYRKEMTGSLDEVQINTISQRYQYVENLRTRKEEIVRLIDEQGKLTEELAQEIAAATVLQQLEDIYRPYKQKRRTKATIAKEKGLEPLALEILSLPQEFNLNTLDEYLNEEFELQTREQVLEGVHEIIAESVGDDALFRTWVRKYTYSNGHVVSKLKDETLDERRVYEMYYDFSNPVDKIASHRVLALNRAEKENVLKVEIQCDDTHILSFFNHKIVGKKQDSPCTPIVVAAYEDSYKRFIKPAIERELRNELTEKADQQAIHIFGENLNNLLLQAPLKGKTVLGFDPAYRTGCKLAVVDETGRVLHIDVIYPHEPAPRAKREEAGVRFNNIVKKFNVNMVAIGNGTASRESEVFVANQIKNAGLPVHFVIVNEAGASVYSASETARNEFPDLQVEQRSAVSIARRLQDPLAELVKIDPQSVGVGQYQHDVAQKELKEQLNFVVETAVNKVGVDVNTASPQLLERVAGITKTTAQNIVTERETLGSFTKREQLKKVPRLGPKSYEQAIGFMRIPRGENILDSTGIHPESYAITKKLLKDHGIDVNTLGSESTNETLRGLSLNELSTQYEVGKETLKDILDALLAPGRDMREDMEQPLLRSDVLTMEDLKPGMELQGTVRNVVDFGAFVDIGVKQDGLVHISKLSKQFVKHPTDVVSVGDIVTVWVMEADLKKERIQLSMINDAQQAQ